MIGTEALEGGRIVRLTIERPDRGNAVDDATLDALARAVGGLAAGGARAAVLAGGGGKHFCAGYDFSSLATALAATEGGAMAPAEHPLERAVRAIEDSPVPIVAAVAGGAIGAGCELALACDFRVAAAGARFLFPPARIGLVYSHTGIARVIALAGAGVAKEMFLLGAAIDPERGERLGLVHKVVPDGTQDEEALALARALAANAPLAVGGMKTVINRYLAAPRLGEAALAEIRAIRERAFRSGDVEEGVRAALEKRAPRFEGR